ncbi:MAG: CDP-diacylglycerol--glycerol-3-phosphate 3-phosphatidyltransferase [Actinomycetaceae bacterium]|nr:CDP-diacylglycerol--glycerol-3-phosphate 3-phosphatidyltransferase [Actinomycetaceae bacterium]
MSTTNSDHVSAAHSHEEIWNIPNILTMIRLALVPVFVILLLLGNTWSQWLALAVFVIAAITDHYDGQIARARNLITDFGKIWDPIADKALTLGAFVVLSVVGLIPWWFTIIVAVRELGITWLRAYLLKKNIVVAASSGGKAKTVSQMVLIIFLLIPWHAILAPADPLSSLTALWLMKIILLAIALALTVWSGMVYVIGAIKMRGTVDGDGPQ